MYSKPGQLSYLNKASQHKDPIKHALFSRRHSLMSRIFKSRLNVPFCINIPMRSVLNERHTRLLQKVSKRHCLMATVQTFSKTNSRSKFSRLSEWGATTTGLNQTTAYSLSQNTYKNSFIKKEKKLSVLNKI